MVSLSVNKGMGKVMQLQQTVKKSYSFEGKGLKCLIHDLRKVFMPR